MALPYLIKSVPIQRNFETLDKRVIVGAGNPNNAVKGSPGDLYVNTLGGAGTTLYVKESGISTKTGWVGK